MKYRRDHLWALQGMGALALFVLAIVLPLWFNSLSLFSNSGYIFVILFVGILLAILGLWLGVKTIQAYQRTQLRSGTIHDATDVMPFSDIAIDTTNTTDLSTGDFIISWRAARIGRVMTRMCVLSLNLTQVVLAFVSLYLDSQSGFTLANDVPLFKFVSLGNFAFWPLFYLILYLVFRNRHITLCITLEGIQHISLIGLRRMIRWNEIRMLEVEAEPRNTGTGYHRWYALFSEKQAFWWHESYEPKGTFVQDGLTTLDAAERNQQLINLIVARTGLEPQTFTLAPIHETDVPSLVPSAQAAYQEEAE